MVTNLVAGTEYMWHMILATIQNNEVTVKLFEAFLLRFKKNLKRKEYKQKVKEHKVRPPRA